MYSLRAMIFALATCAMLGCTSLRSVTSNELDAEIAKLEPGDRVSVLTPRGWHDDMIVVTATAAELELKSRSDERVTVMRADLWELKVSMPSSAKTGALAGAIAGGVLLAIMLGDGWEFDY